MVRRIFITVILIVFVVNAQAQTYFATAKASRANPYVGQEVTVTITAYTSTTFDTPTSSLPITVDTILTNKALIVPLTGQMQSGTANIKGTIYSTITFPCKVYPYSTGKLIFPKVHITASIIKQGAFIGTETDLFTKPITLKVQPLPGGSVSSAFVSNRVELAERWVKLKDTMMTGEIAYRKITATAYNTLPYFIDSIQVAPIGFARDYLKTDTLFKIQGNYGSLAGSRQDVYLYLFTEKGHYQIPPASITYFNPFLKKYLTIKTRERQVTVIPNPNQAILATLSDSLNTAYSTSRGTPSKNGFTINKKTTLKIAASVLLLFAVVWLIIQLTGYIKRKRTKYKASPAWIRDQMYKALKKGDRERFINLFYKYLLEGKNAVSLEQIIQEPGGKELKELIIQWYNDKQANSKSRELVSGLVLKKQIRLWDQQKKQKKTKHLLKQIYFV